MSNKDFLVCVIFSLALVFAVKFFWKWFNGGINGAAVSEWMNRGFVFWIGFAAALLVVILVLKAVSEWL